MLEEEHRVRVADGGLQQATGVRRRAWRDDLESHGAGEVRLVRLRVIERTVHATAVGHADHHGHGEGSVGPVAHSADLADDLVEGGVHEVGELHLGDGAQPVDGGPGRGARDHCLGERRVEDALVAVLGPQAVGRAEDAALAADVLAEDHHPLVALHLLVHGEADRLEDVELGHGSAALLGVDVDLGGRWVRLGARLGALAGLVDLRLHLGRAAALRSRRSGRQGYAARWRRARVGSWALSAATSSGSR